MQALSARTSSCTRCIRRQAAVSAPAPYPELYLDFLRPAFQNPFRQASTEARKAEQHIAHQQIEQKSRASTGPSAGPSRARSSRKTPLHRSNSVSTPFDYSEPNPARALERLSTLPLNPSDSLFPFVSSTGAPIPLAHTPEGKAAEAARRKQNKAVESVRIGVGQRNWQRAFENGWVQLFETGENLQDRLDLGTSEKLVGLLVDLPNEKVEKDWQRICKMLLIPVAKREVGNEHRSAVGEWVWSEIRKGSPAAHERVMSFWEDFQSAVQQEGLAKRLGHPFELLQIPTNLFIAVSSAYCLSNSPSHTLSAFLATFSGIIAVPPRFGHAGALSVVQQHLRAQPKRSRSPATQSPLKTQDGRLSVWFRQFEVARIWARQGEHGIRLSNAKWRERRNEKAVVMMWERIKEAVETQDQRDTWWTIDWRDEKERNKAKQNANKLASGISQSTIASHEVLSKIPESTSEQISNESESDAGDDLETFDELLGFSKAGASNLLRSISSEASAEADSNPVPTSSKLVRPTLPAVFTPALVAEFLHGFLHLDMSSHATSVWEFCKSTLGLKPTLIMWNALLLGHSHQRNPAAVESIFTRMFSEGGVNPDAVAWSILINSYFRTGQVDLGLQRTQELLANQSLRQGLEGGKLPIRIYNVIVNALLWNDRKDEAFQFIENMMAEDGDQANAVGVDIYTVNIVLRYFSRPKTHDLAGISEALKWLEKYSLVPDTYTFTTILDALLRAGRADAVERIHKIMETMKVKPSVATYGAMIDHLVKESIKSGKEGGLDAALELLRKMQDSLSSSSSSSTRPTEITYTSLIQGFARFSSEFQSTPHLETAEDLHREMLSLGIPPNRITYNSLMSANLAADDLSRAMQHFNAHRELKNRRSFSIAGAGPASLDASVADDPDLMDENKLMSERIPMRTWQALISGLAKKQHWGYAQNILKEMKAQGVQINSLALAKLAQLVERRGRPE